MRKLMLDPSVSPLSCSFFLSNAYQERRLCGNSIIIATSITDRLHHLTQLARTWESIRLRLPLKRCDKCFLQDLRESTHWVDYALLVLIAWHHSLLFSCSVSRSSFSRSCSLDSSVDSCSPSRTDSLLFLFPFWFQDSTCFLVIFSPSYSSWILLYRQKNVNVSCSSSKSSWKIEDWRLNMRIFRGFIEFDPSSPSPSEYQYIWMSPALPLLLWLQTIGPTLESYKNKFSRYSWTCNVRQSRESSLGNNFKRTRTRVSSN